MSANTRGLEILPRTITDSRGAATIEVELRIAGVSATASAPAGKTKGGDEARTVPVDRALANVRDIILPLVRAAEVDLASHAGLIDVEERLIERAGANCEALGAGARNPANTSSSAASPPSTRIRGAVRRDRRP